MSVNANRPEWLTKSNFPLRFTYSQEPKTNPRLESICIALLAQVMECCFSVSSSPIHVAKRICVGNDLNPELMAALSPRPSSTTNESHKDVTLSGKACTFGGATKTKKQFPLNRIDFKHSSKDWGRMPNVGTTTPTASSGPPGFILMFSVGNGGKTLVRYSSFRTLT